MDKLIPTGIRSPELEARHAGNKIILTIMISNKVNGKQTNSIPDASGSQCTYFGCIVLDNETQ
jgi:hypothetical protein